MIDATTESTHETRRYAVDGITFDVTVSRYEGDIYLDTKIVTVDGKLPRKVLESEISVQ